MKRVCGFILSLFLNTSSLHAGSVEIAQWLPWNFIQKELLATNLESSFRAPEYVFKAGIFSPKAQNFSYDLKGHSNLRIDEKGLVAESLDLSATVTLDKLLIDEIISSEFSGNHINVHVKGECSAIALTVPRFEAHAEALFATDGQLWFPDLRQFTLNFPVGSIVSEIRCTGLEGLGSELTSAIHTTLQNPAFIEGLLRDWLRQKIHEEWVSGWAKLESLATGFTVTHMDRPTSKGIFFRGSVPLSTSKIVSLVVPELTLLSADVPQLVFSSEGFSALLESKFLDLIPNQFDLRTIPAFLQLLNSSFLKFVAWPDLNRFSNATPFLLSFRKSELAVSLQKKSPGLWETGLRANGQVDVEIQHSFLTYLTFGLGATTTLTAKIQNGFLDLATGKVSANLLWNYGAVYQALYSPNPRIAVQLLRDSLTGSFSNQKLRRSLPSLKFDGRTFLIKSTRETESFLIMNWEE